MAPTVFDSPAELLHAAPTPLGTSDWIVIDQARIDAFADATDDHQWIHVDPTRAAAGPFKTTIAHGFLSLAISSIFLPELIEVRQVGLIVNYGLDRVRFPAPVPSGSRIRGTAELMSAVEVDGGVQAAILQTVDLEGSDKPACVATKVLRYLNP